jgi:hypothetical protein
MFWQNDDKPTISVTAGSIEDSRDLKTWHHIFIEEKGCYYNINSNGPQLKGYGDSKIDR